MATQAEELERFLIRIMGDASQYFAELESVESRTGRFRRAMESEVATTTRNIARASSPYVRGNEPGDVMVAAHKQRVKEMEVEQKKSQRLLDLYGDYMHEVNKEQQKSQSRKGFEPGDQMTMQFKDRKKAMEEEAALREKHFAAENKRAEEVHQAQQAKVAERIKKRLEREAEAQAEVQRRQTIKGNFPGDTMVEEFKQRQAEAEKAANKQQKQVDEHSRKQQKALDYLSNQNQRKYDNDLKEQKKAADSLDRQKQRAYEKELRDQELAQKRSKEANKRFLDQLAKDAQKLMDKQDREAAKAREKAEKEQLEARKQAAQRSANIGKDIGIGIKATGVAGGAVAAGVGFLGKATTEAFADFDQALTHSTSIMNVTDDQVNKIKESIFQLSKTGKQTPVEIANALYQLASAGFKAESAIKALPIVQKMATAGMLDMTNTAKLLTTAQGALGLRSDDAVENMENMARVADVVTKASKEAQGTVRDFAFAFTRDAGAALRSFHKDVEEGAAVLAVYSRQGLQAEIAGNNLGRVLRMLADKAVENQLIFKQMGIEVFDKSGKMKNMADIIQNLEKSFSGMSEQGRSAALHLLGFEARVQHAIMPLIGQSAEIRKLEKEFRNAGGTVDQIANKQMKSFNNQLQLTTNTITVAAIRIGETLAPALLVVSAVVRLLVDAWEAIPKAIREGITVGVAFGGILGGIVATLIGTFVAFNAVLGGIPLIILAISAAAGIALSAIAGLGYIIFQQAGGWEMLKKKAQEAWEWLEPVRKKVTAFFIVLDEQVRELAKAISEKLSDAFKTDGMEGLLTTLMDWVDKATFVLERFDVVWDYVWKQAKYYASVGVNFILDVLNKGLIPSLMQGMQWFADNFGKLLDAVMDHIDDRLSNLFPRIAAYLKNMIAGVTGNWSQIDIKAMFMGKDAPKFKFKVEGIEVEGFDKDKDKLKKEAEQAGEAMNEAFEEWKKNRKHKEPLAELEEEAPNRAKKAGEEGGKQYIKGMDSQLKLGQAAIFGSAEALSRILAYADVAREPDESFKVHGGKKVEAVNAGAEANALLGDQVEQLKKLVELNNNILKKDPVVLKNAGL